jgi:hypothetical protein
MYSSSLVSMLDSGEASSRMRRLSLFF